MDRHQPPCITSDHASQATMLREVTNTHQGPARFFASKRSSAQRQDSLCPASYSCRSLSWRYMLLSASPVHSDQRLCVAGSFWYISMGTKGTCALQYPTCPALQLLSSSALPCPPAPYAATTCTVILKDTRGPAQICLCSIRVTAAAPSAYASWAGVDGAAAPRARPARLVCSLRLAGLRRDASRPRRLSGTSSTPAARARMYPSAAGGWHPRQRLADTGSSRDPLSVSRAPRASSCPPRAPPARPPAPQSHP